MVVGSLTYSFSNGIKYGREKPSLKYIYFLCSSIKWHLQTQICALTHTHTHALNEWKNKKKPSTMLNDVEIVHISYYQPLYIVEYPADRKWKIF